MGPAVLLMVCLLSFVGNVTPLSDGQIFAATQHISLKLIGPVNTQFAYVAVFTDDECNRLSGDGSNLNILPSEDKTKIEAAWKDKHIYEGPQMVLTRPKYKKHQKDIHAEYLLLFPESETQTSPVDKLLQRNPGAACVLFYTLSSPCLNECTNIKNPGCIFPKLTVFNTFNNNKKAFVYQKVYKKDGERDLIWGSLTTMNGYMDVFRCPGGKCVSCFVSEENKDICLS